MLALKMALWLEFKFVRNDLNSHRYVTSPQNQRIEGWWSFFCRTSANWWINHFKDLCDSGTVDLTVHLEKELLWFCYAEVLQRYLKFSSVSLE